MRATSIFSSNSPPESEYAYFPKCRTIPFNVCVLNLAGIVIESSAGSQLHTYSTTGRGDTEDHDVMRALVSPSQTEMHPQTLAPNYIEL